MTGSMQEGYLQIFNVDHGACALLTLPSILGNRYVLIDCGHSTDYKGGPWTPGYQLKVQGINNIDLLLITNYDEDHMSGAPSLVEHGITVERIFGNPTVDPSVIQYLKEENGMGKGTHVIAKTLAQRQANGQSQEPQLIPGLGLSWFCNRWPHWTEENNLSLVCHLSINGFNFLFTGDMERRGMQNLLAMKSFTDLLSGIHVLIAPHHGRENGKCPEMFDEYGCRPELVIISDCEKRHQSQETVGYYGTKATGIADFRGQGRRRVLTTRTDDFINFNFRSGRCFVE